MHTIIRTNTREGLPKSHPRMSWGEPPSVHCPKPPAGDGEPDILWKSSPVWWSGILGALGSGIASVVDATPDGGSGPYRNSGHSDGAIVGFLILMGVFLITFPIRVPYMIMTNLKAKITVTDEMIVFSKGLIFRSVDSLRTRDIENIEIQCTFFGTGVVTLRAPGSSLCVGRVPDCNALRQLIHQLITS